MPNDCRSRGAQNPAMRTIVVIAFLAASVSAGQSGQTFRATADTVLVDALVVARDGTPIAGLKPEQFEVFIDGRRRQIERVEFISATTSLTAVSEGVPASPGAAAAPAAPFSDGRVFVIAVDQMSFPLVAQSSAREAVRRIIESVKPEDYIGLVALESKTVVAPTRDRHAIRKAAEQIQGLRFEIRPRFNVSATEATLIKARDATTLRTVQMRECGLNSGIDCPTQVRMDAEQIVQDLHRQASGSISGLHTALDAVATLPGRKNVLVISAGLPMSNRPGVEPNIGLETNRLAAHAAAVNANLYVFYMNVHFLRAFSVETGRMNNTIFQDVQVFRTGLEKFAAGANGALFEIQVDADPFVTRVMRETAAYYLLGVTSEPRDRDGKEHYIRVQVKQVRDATVRYRTVVTIPVGK